MKIKKAVIPVGGLGTRFLPATKTIERGVGNEWHLTDALRRQCENEKLFALELEGKRYDIGDKAGYIKAMIEVALLREDLHDTLLSYLENIVEEQRMKNSDDGRMISKNII